MADRLGELESLLAPAEGFLELAGVRERVREVRVAASSTRAMADSLELVDGPAVVLDRGGKLSEQVLGQTQVDQAPADLLSTSDALRSLQAPPEDGDGLFEPARLRVGVAHDAERCRQAA